MKKTDALTGKLFLRPAFSDYQAPWQRGRIDSRLNKEHYLIELYPAVADEASYLSVASIAEMVSWKIYDHNEGRAAWERESVRLQAAIPKPSTPPTENT